MKYAKINAAVVATVLTLTLAGCGKEEAQDAKSAAQEAAGAVTEAASSAAEATTEAAASAAEATSDTRHHTAVSFLIGRVTR